MQFSWTSTNFRDVETSVKTSDFTVFGSNVFLETCNGVIFDECDGAATKAGAGHAGTQDAGLLPGRVDQCVQLNPRNLIIKF